MERTEQNNNQNQQSSDNHSNDSNSSADSIDSNSSLASNHDSLSLHLNNGSNRSSTPWYHNSNSLLQNYSTFGFNRLSINGAAAAKQIRPPITRSNFGNRMASIDGGSQRSSPANGNGSVENGMAKISIEKNLMEGCDFVSKCATTIEGCETLRRMLAEEDYRMKEMIITKVTADLSILMVHEIGFEFAKAVFKSCDEQQMSRVLQSVVIGNEMCFVYICNNYYGKEAVKSLIENLKIREQILVITNVITENICNFTNNFYGQQLLEFFLQTCNHDYSRRLLFNAMGNKCIVIGTNRFGCIFLQHCICPVYTKGNLISFLLHMIVINSPILAEDRYGNYVVQHVVMSRIDQNVTKYVVGRLAGRFCDLAKSKSGSNVVEKCLKIGEQREVVKIVGELMNSTQLLNIAQNPFGNYVLQSALEQAYRRGSEGLYRNLVKRINGHASILQTHLYGRTVMQKIRRLDSHNFSFDDNQFS